MCAAKQGGTCTCMELIHAYVCTKGIESRFSVWEEITGEEAS